MARTPWRAAGEAPRRQPRQCPRAAGSTVWVGLGALVVVGLLAGCQRRVAAHGPVVSDSTFVRVFADLRRAVMPGGAAVTRDSAGRDSVRDSILAHYHVTAARLESTASRLADNTDHAAEILRVVDKHVQAATQPAQPTPVPVAPPGPPSSPPAAGPQPGPQPGTQPGTQVAPQHRPQAGPGSPPAGLPLPRPAGPARVTTSPPRPR